MCLSGLFTYTKGLFHVSTFELAPGQRNYSTARVHHSQSCSKDRFRRLGRTHPGRHGDGRANPGQRRSERQITDCREHCLLHPAILAIGPSINRIFKRGSARCRNATASQKLRFLHGTNRSMGESDAESFTLADLISDPSDDPAEAARVNSIGNHFSRPWIRSPRRLIEWLSEGSSLVVFSRAVEHLSGNGHPEKQEWRKRSSNSLARTSALLRPIKPGLGEIIFAQCRSVWPVGSRGFATDQFYRRARYRWLFLSVRSRLARAPESVGDTDS